MVEIALSRPDAGPPNARAHALNALGRLSIRDGGERYPERRAALEESLAIFRALGDLDGSAEMLNTLGDAALARGDHSAARVRFQESRALCRELGNTWDAAGALLGAGHVALAEGDNAAASGCYADAVKLFASLPDWDDRRHRTGVAACLAGLAGAAAPERAPRLYGAVSGLRATVGRAALHEFDVDYPLPGNRAAEDRSLATVRAALGDAAFSAAWAAGQALTLEQAVAEALGGSLIGNDASP